MSTESKNNNTIRSISKILRSSRVEESNGDSRHTHVSMINPKGKFVIHSHDKIEEFWNSYCSTYDKSVVGVAEKTPEYIPVVADVDLKIEKKPEWIGQEGQHLYTDEQLMQVVNIYQSVLKIILEKVSNDALLCVVLEKPMTEITKGNKIYLKNGFHLHFPHVVLQKVSQEIQLIPRVQNILKEKQTFISLGIEDSSEPIDKACCKVPWLMYGSRKSQDQIPYTATKCVTHEGKILTIQEAFNNYTIYDSKQGTLSVGDKVSYYLPRILTMNVSSHVDVKDLKKNLVSPLLQKHKEEDEQDNRRTKHTTLSVKDALEFSAKLLPLIGNRRSEDRNDWMTVGWILYNIGDGSYDAMNQWLDFSSRCESSYDEDKCIYEWDRMKKGELTIGTLRYFASVDSPEEYKALVKEIAESKVKDALEGSHNDIAKVLHTEYGDEFICASVSNKIWYQFKNHHWSEIEEGVYLRKHISSTIAHKFADIASKLCTEAGRTEDKPTADLLIARAKVAQKLVCNLKSAPFKNNVMREAIDEFYSEDFCTKLNQNPFLIGFKNGVYDLKNNMFRSGIPEDYISKCAPIEYIEFTEHDEDVQEVITFLNKVFPDPQIREYFLNVYSNIFVGGNPQKKVYVWTGEGDNGKSITQMFFEKMLGQLAIKFNTQYFTGKKVASGTANPELSRAAPPVRHITMEEPDADEQLNIGELKKLSGGDSYWARDLFQTGKSAHEVFPQFTLSLVCNKLPRLRQADKATWNRIRVIPFESTFVDPRECSHDVEEQYKEKKFPMDKALSGKIPKLTKAFAWYLLQHRQKVPDNYPEPKKVMEATEAYRQQNDTYRQFSDECTIEDYEATLSLTELYGQFKEWFKESVPGQTLPTKNDIKDYFIRAWGDVEHGNKWKGYRIRSIQDDVEEGEAIILEEDMDDYVCVGDSPNSPEKTKTEITVENKKIKNKVKKGPPM
jgi:P4 family phage/plasmid primase-like protien